MFQRNPESLIYVLIFYLAPLHLVARKSCQCNIFLTMQYFLDFSGKKILPMQQKNVALSRKCCIGKIFLPLKSRKCCIGKKMLHWQDFLVNARFSCKCNIFLPLNVKVLSTTMGWMLKGRLFSRFLKRYWSQTFMDKYSID